MKQVLLKQIQALPNPKPQIKPAEFKLVDTAVPTGRFREALSILLELGKVRITAFVTVSAAAGYIFFSERMAFQMILPLIGIFLLACGSSAMNHYQERKTDPLMPRTSKRPIPSGRISPSGTLGVIILLSFSGLVLLYITGGIITSALGALAMIWYNAIYTPMKRITSLAVVPGAVIGAIPPAIGWVSAGGNVFDTGIIALSSFFFIWQIPHFWLLQLIYEKQYREAGFPTLLQRFSYRTVIKLTYSWIAILSASGFALAFAGLTHYIVTDIMLFAAGSLMLIKSAGIFTAPAGRLRFAFMQINIFVLIVIMLVSADKLIFGLLF